LSDSDRLRHTHIVGSSGSGKTEATKHLLFEDIKYGRGVFIIDAKGDRELYREVQGYCRKVGREADLSLLSAAYPNESAVWNPCGLGDRAELQSKFYNSNIYSEPFYAKACESGLLKAFSHLAGGENTLGFGLNELVSELKYQANQSKDENIQGLFYDFSNLAESEWGPILGSKSDGFLRQEISLLDVVLKNKILFVDLPTEGRSVQSSRIGRLLTQELILVSGMRKTRPSINQGMPFSVFIDEFDAFATESFVTFLNKGRSSNFMIHIAHQTLSDLKRISPTFAGQVLGNCNVHVVFRQDDPDDSDYWSRFFGTKRVVKATYQSQNGVTTGTASNRETQEFNISPDKIRAFKVGRCVVSVKTTGKLKLTRLSQPKSYAKFSNVSDSEPQVVQRSMSIVGRVQVHQLDQLVKEVSVRSPIPTTVLPPTTQDHWKIFGDFKQSN
jgi:hypothetical protein